MRWFVRTAVAVTLSALAVAALTWAEWPRARSVVALPLGNAAGLVYFQRLSWGEAAPWRLIAGFSPVPQLAYTFLHEDGRVVGPWLPATDIKAYGFDRDQRLLAAVNTPGDVLADERLDWPSTFRSQPPPESVGPNPPPFQLLRYDPATGRAETVLTIPGRTRAETRLSRDLSTLAVAVPGDPLRFDVYDLAAGTRRASVTVPGRRGSVNPDDRVVAALEWEVTQDGRSLVLTEGWDGTTRTTPAGVEVYDAATGRLVRRVGHAGPASVMNSAPVGVGLEPDVGATRLRLTNDGAAATYAVTQRLPGPPRTWWDRTPDNYRRYGFDLATWRPVPAGHPTLQTGPFAGGPAVSVGYGRAYFWVGDTDAVVGLNAPAGEPYPGYAAVPFGISNANNFDYQFVPGRAAFVVRTMEPLSTDDSFLLKWTFARLGRPARLTPLTRYYHYDGPTDEWRRFHGANGTGPDEAPSFSTGPHDLAILTNHPGESRATVTLWDLPPRPPWAWSVPAGVGVGVLLTTAGVRVRRRRGLASGGAGG